MQIIIFFLLFVTGAAIGSFLNVIISRSIDGEQWQTGRSHCDFCGKTLAWYDMFPLFSYLVYRGKSRCCHKLLSIQHPVVETLTGALFVWWYFVGTVFFRLVAHPLAVIQPLFWLIIGLIFVVIGITDLFYGLIPTAFVTGGTVLTVLYRVLLTFQGKYHVHDFILAIASAVGAWAFFASLRVITRGRGMGDGDVLLAVFLGFLLGWPKVIVGVLSSFIVGALVSTPLLLAHTKKMSSTVPFGPFMIVGTLTALVWGDVIWRLLGF